MKIIDNFDKVAIPGDKASIIYHWLYAGPRHCWKRNGRSLLPFGRGVSACVQFFHLIRRAAEAMYVDHNVT